MFLLLSKNLEKRRQIKATRTTESRKTDGKNQNNIKETQERMVIMDLNRNNQTFPLKYLNKHLEKLIKNGRNWKEIEHNTIK